MWFPTKSYLARFFLQKTFVEQLIFKAIILQISQLAIFKAQIKSHHKTKVKKNAIKMCFFFKNLLRDYSRPQQAALGLFWATLVTHSSVRVNMLCNKNNFDFKM